MYLTIPVRTVSSKVSSLMEVQKHEK